MGFLRPIQKKFDMKKNIFILLFIIIYSCQKSNSGNENTIVVNLSESLDKREKLNLSVIASRIKYIPLESSEECWISNIFQIKLTNKHIYVLDDIQNTLFQFDLNGKFKRKIGRRGNGPDEYNQLSNFGVTIPNQNTETICVTDYSNGNIYIYNELGQLKSKFKPLNTSSTAEFLDNESILTTVDLSLASEYNNSNTLNLCSIDGKIISQYPTSDAKIDRNSTQRAKYISRFHNNLQYYEYYDFSLYELNSNRILKKKYVFDLGENSISKEEFKNQNQSDNNSINLEKATLDGDIIESDNYIFSNIIYKKRLVTAFYSKKEKKAVNVIFNLDVIDHGFHNDLDGGMPFWPIGTSPNGEWISYFSPILVKNKLQNPYFETIKVKNKKAKKKFRELIDKTNEYNNPIIQITTPI